MNAIVLPYLQQMISMITSDLNLKSGNPLLRESNFTEIMIVMASCMDWDGPCTKAITISSRIHCDIKITTNKKHVNDLPI